MEIEFYITFGIFFLICVIIMVHVNHQLMKSADKRLAAANTMVLKLAESADKLAESVAALKDLTIEINTEYKAYKDDKQKELDRLYQAHVKLTNKYEINEQKREDLYESVINRFKDLCDRPTINNTNRSVS